MRFRGKGFAMSTRNNHPRRLLWIVNHKTLLPAEVPIFRELGWEVFIPKIIPADPDYRSGVMTHEYDSSLTISKAALQVLNAHEFYGRSYHGRPWAATVNSILNEHFDVLITSISAYVAPLREAITSFQGLVVARVFGREHPETYAGLLQVFGMEHLLHEITKLGSRFVFAQGYGNLAEIEPAAFRDNARTVTIPLAPAIYRAGAIWRGKGNAAIVLCPGIKMAGGYYKDIYDGIKRDFGDLPHRIFGRQIEPIDDPSVLAYLSDEDLIALYAEAPVFIYPSAEPRHIHYSPIEAMVVGTPVLYRRGALTDILAGGADLPGACASTAEMRAKAERLLAGDLGLAEAVRQGQQRIVDAFALDLARRQWAEVLRMAA